MDKIPLWKGERIKHYREAAGLSQSELSERLYVQFDQGYEAKAISRLERDDVVPNRLIIERIAHILEINPANFFDGDELEAFVGARLPDSLVRGDEPEGEQMPQPYAIEELWPKYESMPLRYSNLDVDITFENPRWHATNVNEARELNLPSGATVSSSTAILCKERFISTVYASGDVAELLRDTTNDVQVRALARTVYGTIVDPDSWVSPPDTPWKDLTGFSIRDVLKLGHGPRE